MVKSIDARWRFSVQKYAANRAGGGCADRMASILPGCVIHSVAIRCALWFSDLVPGRNPAG
jgi:hypothetical protein